LLEESGDTFFELLYDYTAAFVLVCYGLYVKRIFLNY